ncbi:aquaporin AQPcic-like isoform X2 [Belonocnema kinseyi]|uniref:aquaporin AQPcic-like isoform X2 n=1 Tax=Belonocnema kinseyi TaxID=2817044 RepID=UPI00143DB9E9|nr:aquaporin AQPcic-like isoform X2 [Belonocnema kinseyi]
MEASSSSVNHLESASPIFKTNGMLNSQKKIKRSWFRRLMKDDVTILDALKMSLAELIGTGILVFLGCLGCVGSLGTTPSTLSASLIFGLTVLLVIQGIGHISGAHINPAITVGAIVLGKKSLPIAIIYIIAQLIGGILGYGLLKAVTPDFLLHNGDASTTSSFCVTDVHNKISVIQGFIIEILATGMLMFMTCGAWDARNSKYGDSSAIKSGLTVTAICLGVAPYTGCSMNPARSLAPAVWNNYWANHWIFWFGPFGGSLIGALLYRAVFWPNEIESESFSQNNVEGQKMGVFSDS